MNLNTFMRFLSGALIAIALTACDAAPSAPATETAPETDAVIAQGEVEKLAETADPRTLYVLGNQYAVGDGVDKDQDIAERLWAVACDKGHAYACSNYGSRQIGYGNFDEAERTLIKAAEAGVIDAARNLSELYDNSEWSGTSPNESVKWFEVVQALESPAVSPTSE